VVECGQLHLTTTREGIVDQLLLRQTVRLEGRDILGRYAVLAIGPNTRKTGWIWEVGGKYIRITPDIMESLPRRAALRYGKHVLNEFEHIGILRAAGLQHVRISCSGAWPPYDGGSFALWQAVMPHAYKSGELRPYLVPKDAGYHLPSDNSRFVSYFRDTNDKKLLRLTGVVEFPKLQEAIYRFSFNYPNGDLLALVRSRTLGWPPHTRQLALVADKSRPLLKFFGRDWPHYNRILWPDRVAPQKALEEIGRHRLLDALAILNFLAPDGTYLAGGFNTVKGNHATDIGLLRQLA
jgi:hypothetical protein